MNFRSRQTGIVLLVTVALGWGFNWPVMKIVLGAIPLWQFRAVTGAIGTGLLFLLARLLRERLAVPRREWLPLVAAALTNVTAWFVLVAYGVRLMASGHAAILAFTMPLWAAVLGVLFLGERMDRRRLASLALGAAGIVVLLSHDFGALGTSAWGAAIILLAAFMWAVGVLIQKHVTWSIEPLAQAAWQMGIGILPICVIAGLTEPFAYQHASWLVLGCSAFVGVVGVAYCYFAWFSVVRIFPAQVSAIGSLMVPIVGAVTATWTLGEPFGWREIAALGLVVGAVALVLLRPQPAGETGAETTAETAAATAAPGRSE